MLNWKGFKYKIVALLFVCTVEATNQPIFVIERCKLGEIRRGMLQQYGDIFNLLLITAYYSCKVPTAKAAAILYIYFSLSNKHDTPTVGQCQNQNIAVIFMPIS